MVANEIDPTRTAMLFFDCLKGYLRPDDEQARAAVDESGVIPAMQRIEAASRRRGIPIFYTRVDHRADLSDIAPLIVDLDPNGVRGPEPYLAAATGATPGSWKTEVIDEIAPHPEDYVLRKQRWSAFYQTNFSLLLKRLGIDTIMIAGGATEIGVASTAYAARDRDFNLVILRDACRSRREGLSEFLLERVLPIFARTMTVDEAIGLIESASKQVEEPA
jgi:nicotinamidase-related amidase